MLGVEEFLDSMAKAISMRWYDHFLTKVDKNVIVNALKVEARDSSGKKTWKNEANLEKNK